MSETDDQAEQFQEVFEEMNDALANSMEENVRAQAAFVESWADAVEDGVPDDEEFADGFEGYNRAYEEWMTASERFFERVGDAAEGEDVEPSEFRDIWLQSANEAFKHVMSTGAFAAANGQLVEQLLELQEETDEVRQETLAQMGFATTEDVVEVGERLVELERRQQSIETKLDRILDAVEE